MFCPSNETFQSISEKTKLLAQKCSQQIRIAATISPQQQPQQQQHHQQQQHQHQHRQKDLVIAQLKQKILDKQEDQKISYDPSIELADNDLHDFIEIALPSPVTHQLSIYDDTNVANDEDNNDDETCISNNLNSSLNKLGENLKNFYTYTGGTLKSLKKKYRDGLSGAFGNVNGYTGRNDKDFIGGNSMWYVKPTWRLWGEEREKDAIFTVYLKKVRYHRPTPSTNQDSDDEISHLEWETVRVRFVKAATLSRLVEALATDDGELESTFINVFLSTFRTFSNPKQVLDLLIKRYDTLNDLIQRDEEKYHMKFNHRSSCSNLLSPLKLQYSPTSESTGSTPNVDVIESINVHEQHKKTLVSALHVWLDGFPEDWNEENLKHILGFSSKRLLHSDLHLKVLHRLEIFLRMQAQQSYPINPSFSDQFSGLCLAPAFRGPPQHLLQAYRFPNVPVKHFAEQLTRMDMELFKRLIPHQCLGATWARRDKHEADTVVATVTQFNAVSYRVISSILIEPKLRPQERALHIATWIDIAQELRLLKNFSSLKAIISGLQSNAIYRLSKTWAALSREKMEIFNELARIFSEENNAWAQREVLMREGTAKFADTVGENDRHLQKAFQKQNTHTSHGTIPYLGTFLTDLTMIHAAISDTVDGKLINFDKKRKEFEVLAQIKLLQGAANTYNLRDDHHFDRWFASMLVLDEREAHTLSCQLEAPPEPRKMNPVLGHRKTDSIASNSSSGAGSQFYCEIQQQQQNNNNNGSYEGTNSSKNNSLDRDIQPPNSLSILSASSSISNLSIDSSNSGGQQHLQLKNSSTPSSVINSKLLITNGKLSDAGVVTQNGTPVINAQLVQSPLNKNATPDFYIIRVTYETDNIELDGIVMYKSIMLGNNERTPQVIRNAMMKLDLDGDPEQYTLSQVLPDKELMMPANANVYYAVNTLYNLNFILRPKRDGSSSSSSNVKN